MCRVVDMRLIDFQVLTKTLCNVKVPVTKGLNIGFRRRRRRRVVEPGFQKTRVASWHIRIILHHIPSTFGPDYPYSHQNMLGEQPTWILTLGALILQQVLGFNSRFHCLQLRFKLRCISYLLGSHMARVCGIKGNSSIPKAITYFTILQPHNSFVYI